ncbi:hypothetical protein VTN31DRAFT_6275 [Thermomyces dupontii]|uniref:uncharacterized protein n=1 Tax=Talaromyces thermophilus TaxID=28565 RepID=UPI0037428F2B
MPPFRSLLSRKPPTQPDDPNAGFENALRNENVQPRPSQDSQPSGPLGFRRSREEAPNEYKLSVVNDSGVYLPPSPPPDEKQSFWRRYPRSSSSSNHRSLVDENEPFSISRESFDSYRRSFDISAKSPVPQYDQLPPRPSLDSRLSRQNFHSVLDSQKPEKVQSTDEEPFEDIGLADEHIKPKKKGLFARFGENFSDSPTSSGGSRLPSASQLGFRLPGRKRTPSGQGAELSNIKRESSTAEA